MLFPVEKLLKPDKPICIRQDKTIREALHLMVANDFSQLPIVDVEGKLTGIISEKSIVRKYNLINGSVSLLDLTVDHCQTSAVTLPPSEDLFKALDQLKNVYAIVIVDDREPQGILTDYDTTRFFRDIAGGLLLVEDIEVTLRKYIEAAFPEDNPMQAALMHAFGHNRQDATKPMFEYDKLSFAQHIQLITTERNWSKFKGIFEPKDLFTKIMDQVGDIRNQLAHFRERLDAVQQDALEQARSWLSTRSKLDFPHASQVRPTNVQISLAKASKEMYSAFQDWLKTQAQEESKLSDIRLTFQDIEALLPEPLPSTAHEHESWWSNDYLNHPQSLTWLEAGWRVRDVNLNVGEVTFHRTNTTLMQLFFADLLGRLKATRPGITNATRVQAETWWAFSGGRSGFIFGWAFVHDSLRVELYIDVTDGDENKKLFDKLKLQQTVIEEEIGVSLNWTRLDHRRGCRISLTKPAKVTDPQEKLEEVKQWAVATTIKFVDTFQSRIKKL
jgi:CBS domain-containing protein